MAGELASLGIQVTTNADKASADLDKLANSSAKAEQATNSLSKSSASSAASTTGLTKAQQEYIALVQAGIPVHQRYIDAVGGATAAEKLLAASKGASATASNAATVATNTLARAHGGLSTQAMALSHSIRGAAEMLAQGVPPSRVLAMELNNITYAATGPGGLKGAFASLMQGGLGVAIRLAAMVSPVLAVIGVFTGLAVAAEKSAEANSRFDAELSGIGRTGSASLDDIRRATDEVSKSQEVSAAAAQDWARIYATAGRTGGDVLVGLTSITKQYADATGKDTTDAVKALADAFADPAKGAETLNDQLGFLNVTQMQHIKQLADEGDRLGAQKALYAELDKAIDETAKVHVTGLVKVWQDVALWAENAWHAMVVASGGGDYLDKLNQAQDRLKNDMKDFGSSTLPGYVAQIDADKKAVAEAQAAYDKFNASIKKTQDETFARDATKAAQPLIDKMFPDDTTLRKLQADYDTLAKAQKAAVAAGETPDQYAKTTDALLATGQAIGRVTDAYNKYGGSAGVAHHIAELQAQAAGTTDQKTKGQIATQIHLLQTLGDLTPAQQRLTAAQDAGAIVADKVRKTTDGVVTSYNKNLQALQDQTASQNALNAQVASGSITVQQAIAQEKLDKELKSRIAAIETDTKLTLAQKLDMIQKLTKAQKDYNASQDVGDFQKITDEMQTQVKLAGMSSDERDRENAVLSAQHQINGTLSIDDANKVRALVDQQKAAEQLGRVADGVQSSFQDFFTTVFSGGKDAFHNLVDSIKNQFAQLLAWMATQALINPIVVPVFQSIVAGTLGLVSGGASGTQNLLGSLGQIGSAGNVMGASGFLGGISAQISSATSWLTNGINSIGSSLGFASGSTMSEGGNLLMAGGDGFAPMNGNLSGQPLSVPGTSSLFGSTSLTSAIGNFAQNAIIANITNSILGGHSTGANIGGQVGGFAGQIIGGPIGGAIGSALGSAIGGLFGPGKTAGKASATFDANGVVTGYGGDKATDRSSQAVQSAAQAISQTVQTLQSAGVDISNSISKLVIADNRDKSFIVTSDGKQQTVGAVGDPNSAIQGTLDYLLKGASSSDANISQVLKHYQATGGITADNSSQLASDVAFAKSIENISFDTTKQLSQAATALKTLNDNYQTAIDRAKSLGLSTDSLAQAQAHDVALLQKSTSDAYVAQFQGITQQLGPQLDNFQAAAKSISDGLAQATSDMHDLGGSLTDVSAAASAAMDALRKYASDYYTAQINALTDGLAPLSDYQQKVKDISDVLTLAKTDLSALGASLVDVTNAANKAKAALATAFNTDIQAQLLGVVNSAASSYKQLAASEAQRVADAKAVGGNLSLVNQLNAAEMQKFIVGLSDADRALLVSAGILTSAQSAAAKAVTAVSDGIDGLIDRATAAGQAAQQASQAWTSAQQSLDQSRKALLVAGPGVSPQNAYLAAQAQYADLLQKAQTDPVQAQAFASFASQFLQTSLAYNATGGAYGSDFSKVQDDLAKLSMTAGTQATAQDKLASLSQSSLDALNAMKAQLASGAPNIALLQQQLSAQNSIVAAIEAGNLITAQTASLTASTIAAQISANDNALISAIVAAVPAVAPVIAAAPVAQTSAPTQTATSGQASTPSTATDPAVVAAIDRLTQNVIEMKQAQVLTANALRQGNTQNRFAVNK